jgi:choline dehydrogenase-like flavoprotein
VQEKLAMNVYDYMVVGGGSAGCTVTYRLIQAGNCVLVLETGPDDNNQFVRIPRGFVRLFSTERLQFYLSEPQSAAGENFQDHLDVPFYVRVKEPISLLGEDQA